MTTPETPEPPAIGEAFIDITPRFADELATTLVASSPEPANDRWSMRAAVAFLGVFTLAALGCATWLQAAGAASEVAWTLVGTGVGALAMLATTRLGGLRPE